MAMPATTSASSPCQAPSPAGLGLALISSPGARARTAFGRRRLRLRGAAAAAPTGEDSTETDPLSVLKWDAWVEMTDESETKRVVLVFWGRGWAREKLQFC